MFETALKVFGTLTLIWLLVTIPAAWGVLQEERQVGAFVRELDQANAETIVPFDCGDARGKPNWRPTIMRAM